MGACVVACCAIRAPENASVAAQVARRRAACTGAVDRCDTAVTGEASALGQASADIHGFEAVTHAVYRGHDVTVGRAQIQQAAQA